MEWWQGSSGETFWLPSNRQPWERREHAPTQSRRRMHPVRSCLVSSPAAVYTCSHGQDQCPQLRAPQWHSKERRGHAPSAPGQAAWVAPRSDKCLPSGTYSSPAPHRPQGNLLTHLRRRTQPLPDCIQGVLSGKVSPESWAER